MLALSAPPSSQRTAVILWRVSIGLLALLPLLLAIATRSSVLVLCLSAAAALGAAIAEGQGRALAADLRAALAAPLGLAVLAFLGWSALSIAWSHVPGLSASLLGEFVLPLAAALVLARLLPARLDRSATTWLAVGIGLACVLINAELMTGLGIRKELGVRSGAYIFNRPSLAVLALGIVLVWSLLRQRRGLLALAVGSLASATILHSESGAAALGLMAAAVAALLAALAPRLGVVLAGAGLAGLLIVGPVFGDAMDRLVPASAHARLESTSSRIRIDIWRGFGAAVLEDPAMGAGFGASLRFPSAPVARAVPPDLRPALAIGHPHNAALQVWVELGAVGAGLAAIVLLLMVRAIARLPRAALPPMLALAAAVASASMVGHGAWQGWWPAVVGAAIVWARAELARSSGGSAKLAGVRRRT